VRPLACVALLLFAACTRDKSAVGAAPRASGEPVAEVPAAPRRIDPIRMEVLNPNETPPTFVMRGEPRGKARLVFLHGMCGHALGYAQSFQWSAAKKGTLVAPQGDRECGQGPWATWSGDLAALDRRIVDAFRSLGEKEPIDDIVLMGYSLGATRAEALARRWPERYTRLVLLGAPKASSAQGLASIRGAVMMAGERDRQDQMKAGMRAFRAAGIPATFMVIPKATHGAMGPTPEETMGAALDWLWEHSRADRAANSSGSGG
jgi:predicted esterase